MGVTATTAERAARQKTLLFQAGLDRLGAMYYHGATKNQIRAALIEEYAITLSEGQIAALVRKWAFTRSPEILAGRTRQTVEGIVSRRLETPVRRPEPPPVRPVVRFTVPAGGYRTAATSGRRA